jgi:cell division protein FtsL
MNASIAARPMPSRRQRRTRFVVLLAVVSFLAITITQSGLRHYWAGRQVDELERVRVRLLRENDRLREEIRLLSDPAYVERVAREQLGMVRPGEVSVILVPKPVATPVSKSPR